MMKTYQPKTTGYIELLAACSQELKLLGYSPAMARLNGVGELLQWLEQRGQLDIAGVSKNDLREYIEYLQNRSSRRGGALSPYTVAGYINASKLLFNYAERHGLRGGSPLAGLSLPPLPRGKRYAATRAEISKLYAAAADGPRATAILHLLYGCGLRLKEAERVNVGDIDYPAALLYVRRGKGKKRRVIPLARTVTVGLKEYQQRDRWRWVSTESGRAYLLNDRGRRMRGATIGIQLKSLVNTAKVDRRITPHALRHAVATHLVGGGMDLERVRDFLGHAHLETTQIYTHLNPEL